MNLNLTLTIAPDSLRMLMHDKPEKADHVNGTAGFTDGPWRQVNRRTYRDRMTNTAPAPAYRSVRISHGYSFTH